MLSLEYPAGVAEIARDGSSMGALLTCGERAACRDQAFPQPARLPLIGAQRVRPDGGAYAASSQPFAWNPNTTRKFSLMTRIAVATGGSTGSCPARDPV